MSQNNDNKKLATTNNDITHDECIPVKIPSTGLQHVNFIILTLGGR